MNIGANITSSWSENLHFNFGREEVNLAKELIYFSLNLWEYNRLLLICFFLITSKIEYIFTYLLIFFCELCGYKSLVYYQQKC